MGHSGPNATKCATSASMHDYKNKLPNAAINLCRWSLPRKSLTTQPRGRGSLEGCSRRAHGGKQETYRRVVPQSDTCDDGGPSGLPGREPEGAEQHGPE